MIRTQIQLTEEQARRVKRLATERGVSIAAFIREALDRGLEIEAAGIRRERAVGAIGGFRSGRRDVSEKHDDHLAEAFVD
jgi:predicted DNA-binding protein